MIEYGDSVYIPLEGQEQEEASDGSGPLGRWVKLDDPDYDTAYKEQSKLEESWLDAREEAGDG